MTLIVNPPPYHGRYRARAIRLIDSGVRVGQVFVSGVEPWTCHVCEGSNPTPPVQVDAWVHCSCGMPFILRSIQ